MENLYIEPLTAIIFLPAIAALVLAFFPKSNEEAIRYFTLAITAAVFIAVVAVFLLGENAFQSSGAEAAYMQKEFSIAWIPSFDIFYSVGVDGISMPLVLLTALVSMLAMGASWSITKHVKGYCILFLLLLAGMLGVFLALDFFLFYVFWEVMLLPMYFLIGVWGGPRREYAAIKFFLYTLVGSVLMLIAILMLYFTSDLRRLAEISDFYPENGNAVVQWDQLHIHDSVEEQLRTISAVRRANRWNLTLRRNGPSAHLLVDIKFENAPADQKQTDAVFDEAKKTLYVHLVRGQTTVNDVIRAINSNPLLGPIADASVAPGGDGAVQIRPSDDTRDQPVHTFNLLALAALGQHTNSFSKNLQTWAFILLFIGFAIKVPSVPVHTWLPDAHVEAPTPISMILAGVLLKMGGYGIIRICYPICPYGGFALAPYICAIGVISMVYGGFAALAQKDFKRLVAYSSVSHMGYVVLGLGVWSATMPYYNGDYWNMGIQGAMFQMIAHGISSAGMFFMVGIVYDRVHHRNLNEFGGLFAKMPVYTAAAIGLFFAGLGLPGLCGFIGEVLVVLSIWNYSPTLAIVSAAVVIITAAYILWALQRVYLGAEYRGPHEDALTPSNFRERLIAFTLLGLAILYGVLPYHMPGGLSYMDDTIERQVQDLTAWTREHEKDKMRKLAAEEEAAAANATANRIRQPETRQRVAEGD